MRTVKAGLLSLAMLAAASDLASAGCEMSDLDGSWAGYFVTATPAKLINNPFYCTFSISNGAIVANEGDGCTPSNSGLSVTAFAAANLDKCQYSASGYFESNNGALGTVLFLTLNQNSNIMLGTNVGLQGTTNSMGEPTASQDTAIIANFVRID